MELNARGRRLALTLLGAATAAACSDNTIFPPRSATVVRLDLVTPQTDDGALVIALQGPEVSNLAPASPGYLTYSRDHGPREARIIVVGDLKAGPVLTLNIAPGHQLAEYTATIQQVATRSDALRDDLTGYCLTVTAP